MAQREASLTDLMLVDQKIGKKNIRQTPDKSQWGQRMVELSLGQWT